MRVIKRPEISPSKQNLNNSKDLVALPGLEPGLFALRGPFEAFWRCLHGLCKTRSAPLMAHDF
jgi:hypothetical protein